MMKKIFLVAGLLLAGAMTTNAKTAVRCGGQGWKTSSCR